MSQPPGPTERIYLTGSSLMPVLLAAGLAGVIVGLFAWWPYAVIGGLVTLFALLRWLRDNRDDIARMPSEQHTDTAPIPLSGRE